jgi:cytochrome b6-f complex iron-sulfur subunit
MGTFSISTDQDNKQESSPKVDVEAKVPPIQKTVAAEKPAPPAKVAAPPPKPSTVGSSAAAKSKVTVQSAEPDPVNKLRRGTVWALIGGFLATCFLMFLRFFLPRTLFEPPTSFRIGYPSDYGFGVDTKFQQQYRIWVVRNAEKLFVIYARCTHLGCTPDWKPSENKFKCPCHGSGYTSDGINFEGPAPRPMDRADVKLDPSGQIVVDTAKLYAWPKGEESQFEDDGAFLQV